MEVKNRLKKFEISINHALYDYEIENYAKKLKISNFRGVFDRQKLPKKPHKNESLIFNLDDLQNPGTHWVAVRKINNNVIYFDSYGDLPPPKELFKYYKNCKIYYNHRDFQGHFPIICGQLSLEFLINTSNLK